MTCPRCDCPDCEVQAYAYSLLWPNSKAYHGCTKNIKNRLVQHRTQCKTLEHTELVLQAYLDYGLWESVDVFPFRTKSEALAKEKELLTRDWGTEHCLNTGGPDFPSGKRFLWKKWLRDGFWVRVHKEKYPYMSASERELIFKRRSALQ